MFLNKNIVKHVRVVECHARFKYKLHSFHRFVFKRNTHAWTSLENEYKTTIKVGDGHLNLSFGKLARMTDGCAVGELGDTSVMVTAVCKARSSYSGFVPLTVDYRQKAAAAGRIPTNYLRRELGASDKEILTSRMIDRSIRPLFATNINSDIQLICNLLAVDGNNDPDIVSINAASAALSLSDIPWNGPIGAVRVGVVDGEVIINPSRLQLKKSMLNLVMTCSKNKKIVMMEASAENINETLFMDAITEGASHAETIISAIEDMQRKYGKEKREVTTSGPEKLDSIIEEQISIVNIPKLRLEFKDSSHHKLSRDKAVADIRKEALKKIEEDFPEANMLLVSNYFNQLTKSVFRELIFERSLRCDGRELTALRPISCQVDLFKPLHGSALFQRGQTQFPPYATYETGRAFSIGRRELGHGALAEKSLRPVIPEDFPFTIRLTAEVLESNGSSSMASACAGSLALMDAGVPVKDAVAGVAMGLVTKTDDKDEVIEHRMLTDILGIEDYMGDMDFKMSGTMTGITALQADIKLQGLPLNIIMETVKQSTDARQRILGIMAQTQPCTRAEQKENRPVTESISIQAYQKSRFVGRLGYNLRKLTADTGVSISQDSENVFFLFAPNQVALDEAKERIEQLLEEQKEPVLEFGAIHEAEIVEIRPYGVLVKLYPNMTPSLIHNTQLDKNRISHASVMKYEVGQKITVKYFGRDPATGAMRLSRKALMTAGPAKTKSHLSNTDS